MWSVWLVFCDCGFNSVCPLMDKDKRLKEVSWWERLTEGETGSCSGGWGYAQFSSVQFSRVQFSQVQFSRSVVSYSLRPHGLQQARLPCSSPTPGIYSNSCPSSRWCHQNISSSVVPFSSCSQSSPASGSFQMSQLFTSGGQSIRVSASTSVLSVNI